jgi:hypothetical protein
MYEKQEVVGIENGTAFTAQWVDRFDPSEMPPTRTD